MTLQSGGLTVIGAELAEFQVSDDGGTNWMTLPGAAGYTESGGDPPTRRKSAFEGANAKVGKRTPPQVAITVSAYIPLHSAWRAVNASAEASTLLRYRLVTKRDEIASSGAGRCAIATTGVATISGTGNPDWGTDPDFAVGVGIEIDTDTYTVDEIVSATSLKVNPKPANAVAAAAYKVSIPSYRRGPFAARVVVSDQVSLAAEDDLVTGLTLQPRAMLPHWEIVPPSP